LGISPNHNKIYNFKKGKIMTHLTESPMTGRLKKGHSESVSRKVIVSTDKFQTVSYPTILNGLTNGNMKIELQKKGSMEDAGRSRKNDIDDWSELEKQLIYSKIPNAYIDHLGNVYPSKKEMRVGVTPIESIRTFAKFQSILEELQWESECYTFEDACNDGLIGDFTNC
jgi:hypothetical protein